MEAAGALASAVRLVLHACVSVYHRDDGVVGTAGKNAPDRGTALCGRWG